MSAEELLCYLNQSILSYVVFPNGQRLLHTY
jgi:hypothetical protein